MVPESFYYTKEHEWLKVEGGEATVGITFHAQEELGDIVFVELPATGRSLRAGEAFGTVESVKAVAEVFAPVAGEVVAVNRELAEDPERSALVNRDPYGEGWLIRLRLADPAQVGSLMDAAAYRALLQEPS